MKRGSAISAGYRPAPPSKGVTGNHHPTYYAPAQTHYANPAYQLIPDPTKPDVVPAKILEKVQAPSFDFQPVNPEYRVIKPPLVVVLFTKQALETARALVSISVNEVGWWGSVRPYDLQVENSRGFLVEDMHLVEQTVEPGFNILKGAGKAKLVQRWREELSGDMARVMARVNSLWAWCHSHGAFDTNPSSQDDTQWNLIRSETNFPASLRLIFNRRGQIRADVDLVPEKVRVLNVQCLPVDSSESELDRQIRAQYAALVTVARPIPVSRYDEGIGAPAFPYGGPEYVDGQFIPPPRQGHGQPTAGQPPLFFSGEESRD